MNPGGIRADLDAGTITWGDLFTVQPFGNTVVELIVTGQQIYDLLNQQWGAPQPPGGTFLQISGFGYTWDPSIPEGGKRVIEVHDANGFEVTTANAVRPHLEEHRVLHRRSTSMRSSINIIDGYRFERLLFASWPARARFRIPEQSSRLRSLIAV
jgi:hypothetical protein